MAASRGETGRRIRRLLAIAAAAALMALFLPGTASAGFTPCANDAFPGTGFASTTFTPSICNTATMTMEVGEPTSLCGSSSDDASVWFTFTPASDSVVRIDTFGFTNYDTVIGVYVGGSVGGLSEIACNDEAGPGFVSKLILAAQGGTPYRIQVTGFFGDTGDLDFNVTDRSAAFGGIQGNVDEDVSGTNLQGICVDGFDEDLESFVAEVFTDPAGDYVVPVHPGTAVVGFFDECDALADHFYEFFDDKLDGPVADVLTVTAGSFTTANESLKKGCAGYVPPDDPRNQVVGTDGVDTAAGTAGADVFCLFGGNDTGTAGAGNDLMYGGSGKDNLKGEGNNDKLYGEGGNDKLNGGPQTDKCYGGPGTDTFTSCETKKQ